MSLPQFLEAWPPFSQHRKPDVLGVARGSAESDLCTHAALPDHGPKGLAPDAHWVLTYRRSSHTQPLQHNSATGSATPWPPNVRRSERRRKKRHLRGDCLERGKAVSTKTLTVGSGNPGVASSLSREESLPCSRKVRLPLRGY
ncbi:hypothetical protein J6590_092171 [Homalodisca vitripennis]|nr:hypothetical protein J6590_092171 [Homalodisca vitripennis]